ncbi:hypothetical protein HDU79_002937 [Rhizoclosmatium sp. JEL0117]|nr:hypothetical protein HDU79_002937 [Rhizoclosmatium sp. JEL0117]
MAIGHICWNSRPCKQIHFSTKASSNIYTATFSHLLNAPLSHFDATPSGNMMNRFGKDTQVLDQEVASSIGETIQQVIHGIVVTTMISLASPFLLLFTIPIGIIYTPIARKFLSVQRSLKRLESGSRSPIYSAFGESLQGAVTIRAFGKTDVWVSQMMETLDVNHRAFLPLWAANRWLAGRVETVGALVAFGTGLSIAFAVSERGGGVRMDPGWAGLLLNYSGMFTDVLTWLVRNSAQMEMTMTSVERLLEYTKLKQERPAVVENYPVPESWPTNGSVAFDHLGIQYQTNEDSEAGGSFAVDITSRIQIAPGESVGVVGRTGSGKSTLGMSLVRFEEYAHGTVWIDGVDISIIGLKDLRQKLVVVPQDPFLFQGTVQLNLDPTSSYTPTEIENAFQFVTDSMTSGHEIASLSLTTQISNSGTNLSSGQKQMISLARAVLRKQSFGNRGGVIVFDEATASLDASSERVVKAVIDKLVVGDANSGQRKWTSITIAHRLETVMGLDRVIVLSGGKVVEDGNPRALVKSGNGAFFDLFSK